MLVQCDGGRINWEHFYAQSIVQYEAAQYQIVKDIG